MDGVTKEEDYDQYGNPMREDDDDDEVYVKRRKILHYVRKIILHGKGKVTMRGSIIL